LSKWFLFRDLIYFYAGTRDTILNGFFCHSIVRDLFSVHPWFTLKSQKKIYFKQLQLSFIVMLFEAVLWLPLTDTHLSTALIKVTSAEQDTQVHKELDRYTASDHYSFAFRSSSVHFCSCLWNGLAFSCYCSLDFWVSSSCSLKKERRRVHPVDELAETKKLLWRRLWALVMLIGNQHHILVEWRTSFTTSSEDVGIENPTLPVDRGVWIAH